MSYISDVALCGDVLRGLRGRRGFVCAIEELAGPSIGNLLTPK